MFTKIGPTFVGLAVTKNQGLFINKRTILNQNECE